MDVQARVVAPDPVETLQPPVGGDPADDFAPRASDAPPAAGPAAGWPSPTLLSAVAAALVVLGVVLRFWTTSPLWLDEALTVDISTHPVAQIPHLLSHDGAPPLYYVLLHFWMRLFGHSDEAVRALSGVFSVATLPFVLVAGRRLGGRVVGATALVLVASSPFAIRYGTEARMYSLVALLVAAGIVALQRLLQRPRLGNVLALGLCTALLLYTQYWGLYIVAVAILWLLWSAWRSHGPNRRAAAAAVAAMAVGCLAWMPWLPTFLYQSKHTGTPWASRATFADMVNAVSTFAGGPNSTGRALTLLLFALAGVGLFGVASGRFHIELDLRTRPRARPYAIVVAGTLAVAVVGGFLSNSAFQGRYASVVFVPLLLMVALGFAAFADRRVRAGVIAATVLFGFLGSISDVTGQRTQAAQIAAVLAREGRPGDVVAYCPDQLGPDVSRVLPAGRYQQITFPRETGPAIVNWVDYSQVVGAANPVSFAEHVVAMAGSSHRIWYVWYGGYATYGTKCDTIVAALTSLTGHGGVTEVNGDPVKYFEPEGLVRFDPPTR